MEKKETKLYKCDCPGWTSSLMGPSYSTTVGGCIFCGRALKPFTAREEDRLELIADKLLNEIFDKDELVWGDKDGWCVRLHEVAKHCQDLEGEYNWKVAALADSNAQLKKAIDENVKLKEALFKFIPVTFHGDKKAFEDSEFTNAFKEMVIQAYLMAQKLPESN